MTSEKQRLANQKNAKKSTGPRSSTGKSKVSRNAFRHGLGVAVFNDLSWSPQIEGLARKIAGPEPDELTLEGARLVAEAEIDLARIRFCRLSLLQRAYEPLPPTAKEAAKLARWLRLAPFVRRYKKSAPEVAASYAKIFNSQEEEPTPVKRVVLFGAVRRELWALDRYERRARSRRKTAVRDFDTRPSAKTQDTP